MKVKELEELIRKKKKVLLVDVREKEEFLKGALKGIKIKGAKNIPMGKMFVEAKKGKLPMKDKIVTICKVGGRCKIVAKELAKKGFNIDYLEGGVTGWKKSIKEKKKVAKKVAKRPVSKKKTKK